MSACDAKMRPFPHPIDLGCELPDAPHEWHEGVVRDAAYPGSETKIRWMEADRRTFHGEWPGQCQELGACILPDGHGGRCA